MPIRCEYVKISQCICVRAHVNDIKIYSPGILLTSFMSNCCKIESVLYTGLYVDTYHTKSWNTQVPQCLEMFQKQFTCSDKHIRTSKTRDQQLLSIIDPYKYMYQTFLTTTTHSQWFVNSSQELIDRDRQSIILSNGITNHQPLVRHFEPSLANSGWSLVRLSCVEFP